LRPAGADLGDNARGLLDRAGRRVNVGAPQLGRQQMRAAEDVQRQIAVAVIIAVKEAALLMSVQGVVGGIEIENDLRWRVLVRFHEQIDKQGFDLGPIPGDPVVALQLRSAQLQPVERRFAGQRRTIIAAGRQFARQHRHRRVVAQLVVVIQIFVAQRNPEHALSDQRPDLMLDQLHCPAIGETLGKPLDQSNRPVRRPQQQGTRIRGHPAAVKPRHHRAPLNGCKSKQIRATLCLHRVSPWP
jgi:hypothetical protein